jgi:hypothetical protein
MTSFEARHDRFAVLGDFVYMKVGVDKNASRSVSFGPIATLSAGAALDTTVKMAVVELAGAYEIARWSSMPGSGTALDVYGGGRLWWQQVDVSLALTAELSEILPRRNFVINGSRAFATSGDVSWVDPIVGLRLRHKFAADHELVLSGDVGGFGLGSEFSWQALGAYRWTFARTSSVAWSGLLGYRALYVNYSKGSGDTPL